MTGSYRYAQSADDPGEPVTLQKVRALMVPPGIPDFFTRTRLVEAGRGPADGPGMGGAIGGSGCRGEHGWRRDVGEGDARQAGRALRVVRVVVRLAREAGDARALRTGAGQRGNVQPDAFWNYQGMGNNMVQRVEVVVE